MAGSSAHGDPSASHTDFTTVTALLSRPRLAYLHTELLKRGGWTPTQPLSEAIPFSQSTVYDDLRSLRQTGLVSVREEGRERYYRAEPFKVGIITAGESQLTTITPTISAVIAQQVTDNDVSQFVEEYGTERLIDVVSYVKPYIDGRMTERLAARELDLPTLIGTTILIALEETVSEMQAIDPFFDDLWDATENDRQQRGTASSGSREMPDDAGRQSSQEIQFDEHTRVVFEQDDTKTSE